jgi:hypothetical protein
VLDGNGLPTHRRTSVAAVHTFIAVVALAAGYVGITAHGKSLILQ